MGMRAAALVAVTVSACASAPEAELSFAILENTDPCFVEEDRWFDGLERVWLSADRASDASPISHRCIAAEGAQRWAELEDRLHEAGDLLDDMPIDVPFHVTLVGDKDGSGACPAEGPTGGDLGVCAYTIDPVEIGESDVVHAELRRHCQGLMDRTSCFVFAEDRRQ